MSQLSNVSVVLPSLDPDEKLLAVIDGLLEYGFDDIILINDGSKQENLHYFETAATHPQVTVLHHPQNRGKGAALKTAFTWFLENRPQRSGVVTVDGDNQHHPEDTKACVLHMLETGHLTLGVRDFSLPDVPGRSRFGNRMTSGVFRIFVGMRISDTQTGLRAIPAKYLPLFTQTEGDRFEYETNMLLKMQSSKIPFDEVKIRTVYIEENQSSHFRPLQDSWRIYKLILAHFFRYTICSLLSFCIDEGAFMLFTHLFQGFAAGFALTALPAGCARILSSLFNFTANKKLVFHSSAPSGKALLRYFALAVPIALLQIGLTHGAYLLLHIAADRIFLRGLIHAVVMIVLFIVSYMVQQRWVFADDSQLSEN